MHLNFPVIGLEAEFRVFLDERGVAPEEIWRAPAEFIARPLVRRSSKASQLPTGGAVYFDGGVLEVVTPVIEIAPQCTARVVRSLWEQIGFVRDQLDAWQRRNAKRVRLQAFSCHYNVSYELARDERNRNRTIQKLALLLAHLLPVPVIVAGANRRSSGIGVRPRRDRIEITFDFTPDPGLMAATTALIVGIVRDVIAWPSYRLDELEARGIPIPKDFTPGRHETRSGWIARDFHFAESPFATPIDPKMREIALAIAAYFRESIRTWSDAFSYRVLFDVLRGDAPALLDLEDRPAAYDDVGHAIRWGMTLPELRNYAAGGRRAADLFQPPWRGESLDRRKRVTLPPRIERRVRDRRVEPQPASTPRLDRSEYERVFRNLGSGKTLRVGREIFTPTGVRGWYHALFVDEHGEEHLLSIDEIVSISRSAVRQ